MLDNQENEERGKEEVIQKLTETLDSGNSLSPYQVLVYAYCLRGNTTNLREPSREILVEPNAVIAEENIFSQNLEQDLLDTPEGWNYLRIMSGKDTSADKFRSVSQTLCLSRSKELEYFQKLPMSVFDCDKHIQALENTVKVINGEKTDSED